MTSKIIMTTKVPGSHAREVTYNNAQIFINEDTQGILITGERETYAKGGQRTLSLKQSRYIPFVLIERIEITEKDGGQMTCRDARLLRIALDIHETMDQLMESV